MRAPRPRLRGTLAPPGDKSLSHRALILAALAGGEARLANLNPGADVDSTAAVLAALGVGMTGRGRRRTVRGDGVAAWREPAGPLDCGNAGTTLRLLAGVLAACPFACELTGDESLSGRPMGRIVEPLRRMGARIGGRRRGGGVLPPLRLRRARLRALRYRQPIASAQVKSALLLAGWTAGVPVEVREPHRSRDHTERMLRALGADVRRIAGGVRLRPGGTLAAPTGRIPGDPSAGAFFAAAAAALPGSDLRLAGLCLNPTRLGFYRALGRMGARLTQRVEETWCGEPVGDLRVRAGRLRGVRIGAASVPGLIDEIPVLAVLAAGACAGTTRITGAAELRVKECDRIAATAAGLAALGAKVRELPDGLVITGGRLTGGTVEARGDHRIAMAFRVAGLLARRPVRVRGAASARISHPGFARDLRSLLEGGA